MKRIYQFINFILLVLVFFACANHDKQPPMTLVNLSHLDHLYQDVTYGDSQFGIIHIYSDYPDYNYAWEKHEGIACVDDVARALVVYINHYQKTGNEESLRKSRQLVRCLLFMRADNGYFYNFILEDNSINKTYQRSLPEANWWSWRALWAMLEALPTMEKTDPELADQINKTVSVSLRAILKDRVFEKKFTQESGFDIPDWLVFGSAADQTAILISALCLYPQFDSSDKIPEYVSQLASALEKMQAGDKNNFPYGVFLSWKNIWHGWGHLQSYALLSASEKLENTSFQNAALSEINGFYSYLLKENFFAELHFAKEDQQIKAVDIQKYPQIAYIIRPMVFACVKAYEITKDEKYLIKAANISSWLFGKNMAEKAMYNPHTGRCFDGIQSEKEINKNSGAESTIEALLTLQMLEKYPQAYQHLLDIIQSLNRDS